MSKSIKRLTGILLTVFFGITCMPLSVMGVENAKETVFIFSEPFDGVKTNGIPETLTVTGAKTRIIEIDESNKAFQLRSGGKTTITANYHTTSKKYLISMDISGDSKVTADLVLNTKSTNNVLLSIRDNVILTKEGKEIGSVNSNVFTRLAVALDLKTGTFTVFVPLLYVG